MLKAISKTTNGVFYEYLKISFTIRIVDLSTAQLIIPKTNKKIRPIATNIHTGEVVNYEINYSYNHLAKKYGTVLIQTLNENNEVISSLEKQEYAIFDIDNGISYVTREPKQGIIIKLDYRYDYTFNFTAKFDFSIENKLLLLNSINFVDSLNRAARIRLWLEEINESETHELPSMQFEVDYIKELVEYIMTIETYTGEKFEIPDPIIPYVEFLRLKIIAGTISTKLCLQRPLEIEMRTEDALDLVRRYKENKINRNSIAFFNFKDKILGKDIFVQSVLLNLFCVKPDSNIDELYKSLLSTVAKRIKLSFKRVVGNREDVLFHVKSLKQFDPFHNLEIPEKVKSFLAQNSFGTFSERLLKVIATRIHDYFKECNIEDKISIDLFEDPDEDYTEILLTIILEVGLEQIYEKLDLPVYSILDNNLPKEFAERVSVILEPESSKW